MVPGLVRESVVPAKSSTVSFASRALRTMFLVAGPERGEVHGLGALDVGHEELAGAVLLLHVDGQAEVDVGRRDLGGLAVDDVEPDVHLRHCLEGLDQRVADQVGERDLAASGARQVLLMTIRLSQSSLTGTERTEVAVGSSGSRPCCDRAGRRAAEHGVGRLVARRGRLGALLLLRHRAVGTLAGSAALVAGRGVARGAGLVAVTAAGGCATAACSTGACSTGAFSATGACSTGAFSTGGAATDAWAAGVPLACRSRCRAS